MLGYLLGRRLVSKWGPLLHGEKKRRQRETKRGGPLRKKHHLLPIPADLLENGRSAGTRFVLGVRCRHPA